MLQSIENMREISDLCRTRAPLPEPLAEWLANSFASFLTQRTHSLNEAFGVLNGRGGIPWYVDISNRSRDTALRTLADSFLDDLSLCAQAGRIRQMSQRYASGSWRFDRERDEMPAAYRGTEREYLWRAFKSGAAMPLCNRQLRNILAK